MSKRSLEGVCQVSGIWPIQKECVWNTQKSYPNFFRHNFFQTEICWEPNFFKLSIVGSDFFRPRIFMGIDVFDPNFIAPNNLWAQFLVPKFLGPIFLPSSKGVLHYKVLPNSRPTIPPCIIKIIMASPL